MALEKAEERKEAEETATENWVELGYVAASDQCVFHVTVKIAYVPVCPDDIGIEDGDDTFAGYRLEKAGMLVAYVVNDGITHLGVPRAWLLLKFLKLLVHGQYLSMNPSF